MACNSEPDKIMEPKTAPQNGIEADASDADKDVLIAEIKQCEDCEQKKICRRKCGKGPVIYKGCCQCPQGSINTAGDNCQQF